MSDPRQQFDRRIQRLSEERSYTRPGWHIPVRKVRIKQKREPFGLSLKEWLMYPLFTARV